MDGERVLQSNNKTVMSHKLRTRYVSGFQDDLTAFRHLIIIAGNEIGAQY